MPLQCPSWKDDWYSDNHEIHRLSWNHVLKQQIHEQNKPIPHHQPHSFQIHFNIILPPVLYIQSGPFPSSFMTKTLHAFLNSSHECNTFKSTHITSLLNPVSSPTVKVVPIKNPSKHNIVKYFKPCCSFSQWGIVTKQHNQPSEWRTSTYWLPTTAYKTYWCYTPLSSIHSLKTAGLMKD